MSQNPTTSTLFVTKLIAGSGIKVTPDNGTGVVTVEAEGSTGQYVANTAISTVGAGTLTAAAIVGGLITRSGSTAAFTDTTDTAAAIVAAIETAGGVPEAGMSFYLKIINTTAFLDTLAGGSNVTLAGISAIPGISTLTALVTLTSLTAVSIRGVEVANNAPLPSAKFTTAALTAGTIPAASIVGAEVCYWQNTGATPGAQTFPTAATLYAAIPGAYVGLTTVFRVINTGAGTLTLTADGGATVTLAGTATVAQNVTRDYAITFTSATAATVQSIGSGVSP